MTDNMYLPSQAAILCDFAQSTYLNRSQLDHFYKKRSGCVSKTHYNDEKTGADVIVYRTANNDFYLACSGSSDFDDWRTNSKIGLVRRNGYKYHRGFYDAANAVLTGIFSQLSNFIKSGGKSRIFICGHSSGGAIATILAWMLSDAFKDQISAVYTFGSPMLSNAEFSRVYNARLGSKHYRVENDLDAVPVVQRGPLNWFFGYKHVGQRVWLNRNGQVSESMRFWRKALLLKRAFEFGFGLTQTLYESFVTDHKIDSYSTALTNVLNTAESEFDTVIADSIDLLRLQKRLDVLLDGGLDLADTPEAEQITTKLVSSGLPRQLSEYLSSRDADESERPCSSSIGSYMYRRGQLI